MVHGIAKNQTQLSDGTHTNEDLQHLLELTPKKHVLFITETGMQESPQGTGMQTQDIPGITGKFGLGVHNEAGKG